MSGSGHIKEYSAADIQRYLEGKMLPAEMHAMEKAALDDPFLADAIEGMQQSFPQQGAAEVDAHLAALHQQVQERVRKRSSQQAPVIAFRWWQVAAAAVIVITGGIWAFNFFRASSPESASHQISMVEKQRKPAAATTTTEKPAAPLSLADGDSSAVDPNQPVEVVANHTPPARDERAVVLPEKPKAALASGSKATEPAAVHDDLAARQQVHAAPAAAEAKQVQPQYNYGYKSKADTLKELVNATKSFDNLHNQGNRYLNSIDKVGANKPVPYEQIVIAKMARDTGLKWSRPRDLEMNRSRKDLSEKQAKKNPDALLSGFISGRVTDQANNPLSNALLRVEGKHDYFYTDQKGLFKIPATDSVVQVAVGVTGYYTQNVRLTNNTDNNIALNQLGVKAPNPQLNEALQVKVAGVDVGGKSKKVERVFTNLTEVRVQDAQPEYGWLEFQQYLDKNKRLPAGAPELSGEVVVSFEVNKKGLLSNFNIEQSLSKVHDDEAIRLIKAGPSWKLLKGRKAKATVVVHF